MPLRGLEARREHDFHCVPIYCDLNDGAAVEAHEPTPSPDSALTAFCQLAALRLRTKRALLFFFDVTHAFILAEATRDLSLAGEEIEHTGDPLWLGFTAIPRGFSVCEQTISIVAPPLSAAGPSKPVNVISDLSEDTRFCGRPYVQGAPNARFYAGTPITSPEGINIGAFCVLDDVKRDGLTDIEKDFMRDMSTTIMTHLTLVRAKAEQKRETRMVTALGRFVQESSGLRESKGSKKHSNSSHGGCRNSTAPAEDTVLSEQLPASLQGPVKHVDERPSDGLLRVSSSPDRIETPASPSSSIQDPLTNFQGDVADDPVPPPQASLCVGDTVTRSVADDLRKEAIPFNIQSTCERAARHVRDAIGVDGCVFLDASIGTFGGLREARNPILRRGTDGPVLTQASTDGPVLWSDRGTVAPNPCYVLGSSLSYDMPFDAVETNITEPLLESLLNKYPTGKIWTFEGQGFELDNDTNTSDSANEDSPATTRGPPPGSGAARDRWERRAHADEILRLFPRVRSFGFVGLFDHLKQRWFAGCVFWTSSPFRVLSVESELRYISAFCDVIMTETKRLEVERSDKAKMDFLSSISHELRSPLHGILGSTECLQEYSMDVAAELLVSQVESCGRTLLDIIDHLLEYSRINFSSAPTAKPEKKGQEASYVEAKQFQHLGRLNSAGDDEALDAITEEVIDAAVFSFFSGRDNSTKHNVSVMMDIDFPGSSRWNCRITSGGWKRVCMNIVTNALKYTHSGYIHIGLQTTLVPNAEHQLAAVFTVSDTGRGMSKEFLKNHLFRAFSQEDDLAAGIGLGMNLVAKIVHTFGGKIDVQSEKGVGTRVTVYMPLQQSDLCQAAGTSAHVKSRLQRFRRKSVCVIDDLGTNGQQLANCRQPVSTPSTDDARDGKAHSLLLATVTKACGQLGLSTCRASLSKPNSANLNIITERDFTKLLRGSQRSELANLLGRKPLIIICESSQSERRLRKAQTTVVPGQVVEYLAPPCGPAKLDRAISSCLTRQPSVVDMPAINGATKEKLHVLTNAVTDKPEQRSPTITELPSRPATPSPIAASKDGLVLLLVDDNQINLQLLRTYASKRGHPRLVASNGLEAVKVYKEAHLSGPTASNPGRPNVIMMDINMPILNGYDATRRIRAYEQECGLQPATVIALTGLGSAEAQREAYTCGVDLFLTKPVQLKKLTALLESLKRDRKNCVG